VANEADSHPIEQYMKYAIEYFKTRSAKQPDRSVKEDIIYLASDEANVFAEAKIR
jgi:hypothetical protein